MRSSRSLLRIWFAALAVIAGFYIARMAQENRLVERYEEITRSSGQAMQLAEQSRAVGALLEDHYARYDDGALERLNRAGEALLQSARALSPSDNPDSAFYARTVQNMAAHILDTANADPPGERNYGTYYDSRIGLRLHAEFLQAHADRLAYAVIGDNLRDYENDLRSNRQAVQLLNLFTVLALGGLGGFLLHTGRGMFRDIQRISRQALLLSDGNWEIDNLSGSRYAEIHHVIQAFNLMKQNTIANYRLQRDKAALETVYQAERIRGMETDTLLREAKIRALQMQINPHFLFNTFNMISRSALLEDSGVTILLIESISNIMRYTMRSDRLAPLREEIAALRSYLDIQRVRFQDTIDFSLLVEADDALAAAVEVPPLILQPIVENAILHGVADIPRRGGVDVTVARRGERIVLAVRDNGAGIEADRLAQLREMIASPQSEPGIGIGNVAARLRLFCKQDGLFEIDSRPGEGTEVRMWIPLPPETGG